MPYGPISNMFPLLLKRNPKLGHVPGGQWTRGTGALGRGSLVVYPCWAKRYSCKTVNGSCSAYIEGRLPCLLGSWINFYRRLVVCKRRKAVSRHLQRINARKFGKFGIWGSFECLTVILGCG